MTSTLAAGESALTVEQRVQFATRGLLRLRGFAATDAAAMQAAVWAALRRVHGIARDERATWHVEFPSRLAIPELPAFAPIGGPALRAAVDALLGVGTWDVPKRWGAFHVSFPSRRAWDVPHALWHADFPFDLPEDPLPGVKIFMFVSDVPPRAGGTQVVAGSHHFVRRAVAAAPPALRADTRRMRLHLLASHPWLRALTTAERTGDRVDRFVARGTDVGDVHLQVIELSGAAGEIVITHPWLLHCRASNGGDAPRFMRSIDLYRRACRPARWQPAPAGTTR